VTERETPSSARGVQYKGAPLDSEKGPGLGCFWSQIVVLVAFLVLTPLSVAWNWPFQVSAFLLISVLILLLVAGQTIIFLLRLIAADRRAEGRRRPLASRSMTVGEIEDADAAGFATTTAPVNAVPPGEQEIATEPDSDPHPDAATAGPPDGGVRE
jgi:hypothetical protein